MNLGMIKKKLGENVIGTDGFDKLDNNGYEIEWLKRNKECLL